MIIDLKVCRLRKPELADADNLYLYRNDPHVVSSMGGFSRGFSKNEIVEWINNCRHDEKRQVLIIADSRDNCVGHVGLYNIDLRARTAEFGICIGLETARGQGLGEIVTRSIIRYGFDQLNLRRIYLFLLANNQAAHSLYQRVGFQPEGLLREHEYRDGKYIDVVIMGMLRQERSRQNE